MATVWQKVKRPHREIKRQAIGIISDAIGRDLSVRLKRLWPIDRTAPLPLAFLVMSLGGHDA